MIGKWKQTKETPVLTTVFISAITYNGELTRRLTLSGHTEEHQLVELSVMAKATMLRAGEPKKKRKADDPFCPEFWRPVFKKGILSSGDLPDAGVFNEAIKGACKDEEGARLDEKLAECAKFDVNSMTPEQILEQSGLGSST